VDGSAFELIGQERRLSLRSALPGDFNQVNTAVAALVLLAAGYAGDAIGQALAADPHVPGRMERVLVEEIQRVESAEPPVHGPMPLAVVDFAHTPDAVAAALKALRHNTSGSLIVVLGAGGDRDAGKREAMGAAAAAYADRVVVTDDNPRSEAPADIRDAVLRGAVAQDSDCRSRARADHRDRRPWCSHPGRRRLVRPGGHRCGSGQGAREWSGSRRRGPPFRRQSRAEGSPDRACSR